MRKEGVAYATEVESFSVNSIYFIAEQFSCIQSETGASGQCRGDFPKVAVTLPGENHSGWAWFHFSPAVCSHVVCACSNDRIWSHSNSCCGQFVAVEAIHFRGEKDQKLLQVLCSLWWEAWEGGMALMPQSNSTCVVEVVTSGWASGNYHSNLTYTKTGCSCCESALKIILLNSRTGLECFWSLILWRRFHSS